jgi:hypothetical protein
MKSSIAVTSTFFTMHAFSTKFQKHLTATGEIRRPDPEGTLLKQTSI